LPRGLQISFSKIAQKQADAAGRELLPMEVVRLFEDTYHLRSNPRFKLIDYDITIDRSASAAPPEPGQTQSSKNLKRILKGVISVDDQEHAITGTGNGAISSLANALNSLGIDIDVAEYKEHSIGEGKHVKAATYIECTSGDNESQKVWGVGIHDDVS
jgi:2-isopropylmalate synthase